jgi:site-specific recombinase XerD
MCYKEKIQSKYADQLNEIFKVDNTPEFIQDYFIRLGSEATKRNNYTKIKSMIDWMISSKHILKNNIAEIEVADINNITLTAIMKYLDSLKSNGLESSTVATYKNVLSGFWSYLVDDKLIDSNIIHKIPTKKYKARKKPVKLPAGNSLDMFIFNILNIRNEFERLRNFAIVKLFMGSGIRVSELIGLDLNDLYFDCNEPYVTILSKGEQDEEFKEEVPVNESAVKAVREYLEVRNKYYPNSIEKGVFLSDENSRLTKGGMDYIFNHFSNSEITPHMLRHYVGTKLYEFSGNDAHEVQDQLGHADFNTTLNNYVATNKKKRYDALNMI